jgi:hypothetical protein
MTTGRNMSKYIAAPKIRGVGLPELLLADWALFKISPRATTEPRAVFLVIEITRLVSGGKAMRNA